MVIDVHCHVGLSARRVDSSLPRFSFEPNGAAGTPGFDSYLSPRMLRRASWFFVRPWLLMDPRLPRGDELDARIEATHARQFNDAAGVDRLVLLAFDEYHDDAGRPVGIAEPGQRIGTDLYVSNTYLRALCLQRPDRYLFGGSIHPYRPGAVEMLAELASAGVTLIKWLPIHQNIRADDPRTVAFLRAAAHLRVPVLVHYGGEMSLSRQHMEFEHPGPMLAVLSRLRRNDEMPTVIVAHAATPSFPLQSAAGHRALVDALLGEFADAPLYADISALAAFGRTSWGRSLAARRELHRKLLWGSDYPVPVMVKLFWRSLDRATRARIAALPSWIERDLQLKRALGYDPCVFTQAADVLHVG
jgi:predicted TIM-barrel fold metal-dependent hydrolase